MEENNQDNNKRKDNRFNFNTYWLYGIIIVILLILNLIGFSGSNETKYNTQDLHRMIEAGDVERIVVINERLANVYLKRSKMDKYPDLKDRFSTIKGPQFTIETGPIELFAKSIEDLNAKGGTENRAHRI